MLPILQFVFADILHFAGVTLWLAMVCLAVTSATGVFSYTIKRG